MVTGYMHICTQVAVLLADINDGVFNCCLMAIYIVNILCSSHSMSLLSPWQNGATLMARAVTGGNMEAIAWLAQEYHMDVRSCNVSHYSIVQAYSLYTTGTYMYIGILAAHILGV